MKNRGSKKSLQLVRNCLLLLSFGFLVSCDEPKLADSEKKESSDASDSGLGKSYSLENESRRQIPSQVTLENLAGKSLTGTLLAKSGSEFVIRRTSDSRLFLMRLDALSTSSQDLISEFSDAEEEKLLRFKGAPMEQVASTAASLPPLGAVIPDNFKLAVENAKVSNKKVMAIFLGDDGVIPGTRSSDPPGSSEDL